jgi:hypothetical protein
VTTPGPSIVYAVEITYAHAYRRPRSAKFLGTV